MSRKPKPIDTTDDDPPIDPDEFQTRLMRRLAMIKEDWRRCKPACLRARACVDARLTCRIAPPGPPLSDAEQAKRRHDFQVSLRREMRRRGET